MKPAVFLDRDGTVSEEIGYVNHISRFRLLPYAVDAVRRINAAGCYAVLITNQAGVARGYFPESLIHDVHKRLAETMLAGGAHLDGIYFCLHHPTAGEPPYRLNCDCRKPRPGLIRRAAEDLGIDLARSVMIGDRYSDVQVGWNAGTRGAFVKTGYGLGEWTWQRERWPRQPDIVAEHLLEAVELALAAVPQPA